MLKDVNYVILPIHSAFTVAKISIDEFSEKKFDLRIRGARFVNSSQYPTSVIKLDRPIDADLDLVRNSDHVKLTHLNFVFHTQVALSADADFVLPGSVKKWSNTEVSHAQLKIVDLGCSMGRTNRPRSCPRSSVLTGRAWSTDIMPPTRNRSTCMAKTSPSGRSNVGSHFALHTPKPTRVPRNTSGSSRSHLHSAKPLALAKIIGISFAEDSMPALKFRAPS